MKKIFLIALIASACGGAGGGDEQSSSSIITNCGNRISLSSIIAEDQELDAVTLQEKKVYILKDGVTVTCNIGDNEVGTDKACQKCKDNFNECSQNPEDNGLTDDSKCKEIYADCQAVNCEDVSIEN